MISLSLRSKIELGVAALLVAAALLVWALWPAKTAPEITSAAPEVTQADGSKIAARDPTAASAPAPHIIPAGYHEVRRAQVVVAPASAASSVEVDLSLVSDGTQQRVVASSPDGQVIKALDIPIQAVQMPPPARPWAAGLSYGTNRGIGIWVDRDVGRLVLGATVQRLQDGRSEAQLRIGVRF
jgi:hypothetical protein